MKTTTLRILTILLAATLVLAMGCKSESSPTAPPATTTTPPGTTPPTAASIVLTVSPGSSVVVSSTITVTATVTENGTAVTDGTAVQFTSTGGTFSDTGTNTTIRTTTGGVATAKITSASAANITITATVNNVTKSTTVTFTTAPPGPPAPPSTTPTITAVCAQTGTTCTTPATGLPAGGQQVIITGTNFRQPVRVLFDPGNGIPAKEGFVSSVSATQIVVTSPPFDVTTGQTLPVTITVFSEAGTANEQKVSAANAFTYQLAILTPTVRSVAPTSGPIDGGTRIAIFGDGFQAPVQVFFNSAEAQQLKVTFNEIDVISPTARDTNPNGSGTVVGPVDIRIRNVGSGKEGTFPQGFRYIAKMQITAVNPVVGSANGGTDVTIDGVGFNDPLTVDIAGARAQVIRVSGTEVVARTARLASPCAGAIGPIIITNVDNGDTATSVTPQIFTYIGILPSIGTITSTTNPPQPGNGLTVPVTNPGVGPLGNAIVGFTVGGLGANTTPNIITNGNAQTFTVVVPNIPNSAFTSTEVCTVGLVQGTRLAAQDFPIVFTNTTTGCTTTATVTIAPLAANNPCVIPPPPTATLTVPASGCANGGSVVAAGAATGTATITITNTGGQTLNIGANPVISGANAPDFTIAPVGSRTVAPNGTASYTITFDPSATGPRNATVTFTTNDPNNANVAVCLSGTGT